MKGSHLSGADRRLQDLGIQLPAAPTPFGTYVETVQRARPVVLTALAAVLAFIPLTFSAFWGTLAYTLIGGTAVGTVLTLVFLPALYSIWFRVKPVAREQRDFEVAHRSSEAAKRGDDGGGAAFADA